jgi:hypothetical protein
VCCGLGFADKKIEHPGGYDEREIPEERWHVAAPIDHPLMRIGAPWSPCKRLRKSHCSGAISVRRDEDLIDQLSLSAELPHLVRYFDQSRASTSWFLHFLLTDGFVLRAWFPFC